jgi:hypothetical protein
MKVVNLNLTVYLSRVNILIFGALIGVFGMISIYLGKDVNWDLRNYHFYNGYSFLHGRIDYDYLPAQIQTFNNPLLDLIIYQLLTCVPTQIAGFIIGGIQSLNCFIVLLIAQLILPQDYSPKLKLFVSLLIAVLGAYSPIFIGTTFGDNLTSILVLLGCFFAVANNKYRYILSGLFMGCAAGFKITNLLYALAMLIAVIIIGKTFYQKISAIILMSVGISAGFLSSGGYWMWIMLEKYKNPIFPYYNSIFKSPYFSLINFRDERFIPKNIIHALSYPFLWLTQDHPSLELAFRDLRWLIIYFLFIIIILISFKYNYIKTNPFAMDSKHINSQVDVNTSLESDQHIIILFTFFSFFIWLFQFGYHRYLVTLELISGLAIFCLVNQIVKIKWLKIQLFIFLTVLIMTTTVSPNWGRVPWYKSWFEVVVPRINVPEQTLVVIVGTEPISYVIPCFPQQVRFVRIDGNFVQFIRNTILEKQLAEVIQKHQGNFLMLSIEDVNANYPDILNTYHLKVDQEPCELFKSQFEQLRLCHVKKI